MKDISNAQSESLSLESRLKDSSTVATGLTLARAAFGVYLGVKFGPDSQNIMAPIISSLYYVLAGTAAATLLSLGAKTREEKIERLKRFAIAGAQTWSFYVGSSYLSH